MLDLSHKKLNVWKDSLKLVKMVYRITIKLPEEEKYVLLPQMRRASNSILFNLSEGLARHSKKEKIRFLDISRSSLVELDSQFEVCLELEYFMRSKLDEVSQQMNNIFAQINNLMRSLDFKS